jgi:hypothetical protein
MRKQRRRGGEHQSKADVAYDRRLFAAESSTPTRPEAIHALHASKITKSRRSEKSAGDAAAHALKSAGEAAAHALLLLLLLLESSWTT